MFKYAPPASVNDFKGRPSEAKALRQWSSWLTARFKDEIKALEAEGVRPLFFSEASHALPAGASGVPVPWNGFPKALRLQFPDDRKQMLATAETLGSQVLGFSDPSKPKDSLIKIRYRLQDEYLEWRAQKDKSGKIARYVFTAEGPEYWEHIAKVDPDLLLDLYKALVGRKVELAELTFDRDVFVVDDDNKPQLFKRKGDYNRWNDVNLQEGPIHLTHPANTLGAEINLAARATIQRMDANHQIINEARRLACCSDFGDPNRSSDPTIGQLVNATVRGGTSITLHNPVALYIRSFDEGRITSSSGESLAGKGWWKITRGDSEAQMGLRAELSPPAGANITLDQVRVKNEPLTSGGQLAELITMVLYASTLNLGVQESPPQRCANRCCMPKDGDPETALFGQVPADASSDEGCGEGSVDPFPELASPPAPFQPAFLTTRRGSKGSRGGAP